MSIIKRRSYNTNRDQRSKPLVVGIDAANLRRGGGITHLTEILRAATPERHNIGRVVVWGNDKLIDSIEDRPWLEKRKIPALKRSLVHRLFWQWRQLSKSADNEGCDVLFVPGGSYAGSFRPVVNMSRNLLPFEWRELRRYGFSYIALKLLLLRFIQSYTYRTTDGLIFLTGYARNIVTRMAGPIVCDTAIIPHGVNRRFKCPPKQQKHISEYSERVPYRILYVSIIDHYKHQWNVVDAVAHLRNLGIPVCLDLVGPAIPSALNRLDRTLKRIKSSRDWVHYRGPVEFNQLHSHYTEADLGIFASSCENMPNILVETMAAGLPIACSNRGPMPEILSDTGVFFDPEQPDQIFAALRFLIENHQERQRLSALSYERAQSYSWERCADDTFDFLAKVARSFKETEHV